ncbi:MAG: A/G-specific adenine glycosylase [Candidatus Dormibacteraeota bacterium]|nr:A/G-specific adenine glycosylase [Candidatus Dormibacteraeota bacterium]MBO0759908.1 A/G-specific adenine glycosylase [Candidatus Dormibacteraeota bacterium]
MPMTDVRQAVLAFGARGLRSLPWRATRDPWAVLVSELMLQQTQAARVAPAWERFLGRFPTVRACAAAGPGEVVAAWSGLGYNRRAVFLHRTASMVVERHGGEFPDRLSDLLALPGLGPYTARAVLAFAFGQDVGVLDVNAARVLARAVAGSPLNATEAQDLADALVPSGRGWGWNQALLDLGAQVCTSRAPRCASCPLAAGCRWRRTGGRDPALGSAGAGGRQSRFEGSHRQGRGRLLRALTRGSVGRSELAEACGWPASPDRAQRAASGLVRDGLARWEGELLVLA